MKLKKSALTQFEELLKESEYKEDIFRMGESEFEQLLTQMLERESSLHRSLLIPFEVEYPLKKYWEPKAEHDQPVIRLKGGKLNKAEFIHSMKEYARDHSNHRIMYDGRWIQVLFRD